MALFEKTQDFFGKQSKGAAAAIGGTAATVLLGPGAAIAGALGGLHLRDREKKGKGRLSKRERYEKEVADQEKALQEQIDAAKGASYDASELAMSQSAKAQKAGRRSRGLGSVPSDPVLQSSMAIGSGSAYDKWKQDVYGV
jgi:hypothetical protein